MSMAATVAIVAVPGVLPVLQSQGGPPPDKAEARWVEQTLKRMTLDEKIGQLLVTSFNASFTSVDSDAFDRLRHLVRDVRVGGVHVFGGTETLPAPS